MAINKPIGMHDRLIAISVRSVGGHTTIMISPSELARYNADPDGLVAERLGLTAAQYAEYIKLDGAALCGATTKKGTQCSVMLAPTQMDPGSWLALHREQYCKSHGG